MSERQSYSPSPEAVTWLLNLEEAFLEEGPLPVLIQFGFFPPWVPYVCSVKVINFQ